MAQFMATIKGNRGEASRLGTKKSGMVVRVNGWRCGITVFARVNEEGLDEFTVCHTSGSSLGNHQFSIPRFTVTEEKEDK